MHSSFQSRSFLPRVESLLRSCHRPFTRVKCSGKNARMPEKSMNEFGQSQVTVGGENETVHYWSWPRNFINESHSIRPSRARARCFNTNSDRYELRSCCHRGRPERSISIGCGRTDRPCPKWLQHPRSQRRKRANWRRDSDRCSRESDRCLRILPRRTSDCVSRCEKQSGKTTGTGVVGNRSVCDASNTAVERSGCFPR